MSSWRSVRDLRGAARRDSTCERRIPAPGSGKAARLFCALSFAASTALTAGAPPFDIPYFLPVDLSQLEISVSTTSVGEVGRVLPAAGSGEVKWEFSRAVTVERTGSLGLKSVADAAAQRMLRIPKPRWSDVKASVELTESGTLAAVNATAAGRGDDILLGLAKFAGIASGFWTVPSIAGATVSAWKFQPKIFPLDVSAPPPTQCPPIEQLEIEGVPVEMQAFVSLDRAGCSAFLKLREATANVEAKRLQRDRLAEEVPGASGTDLTNLNKQLQSYRLEVTYAEAVQAERRAALSTLYENFADARCLGKKVKNAEFHELLALNQLPAAAGLGWLTPQADLSREAVDKALASGGWNEMRDLFRRTGVVATLDGAPAAPQKTEGQVAAGKPSSVISWRQIVPVHVRIWTLGGKAPTAKSTGNDADACAPATGDDPDAAATARISFDGVLDVLHPNSPIRTLPIEAKAFADRSLGVTFDSRGRPRKIDSNGSSATAGFALAAVAAAQGYRDELDTTLKKRVSIEESRRTLALDGLNDKIAALEAQKKELDARAALLGASGSFDDIVARQKLDSELKLLEAQVALRTAEATAKQRVAIADLEKQVLETQKRLALLEAQQALAEAGHSN